MSLFGFKTELELNNKQKTARAKHEGAACHAYNWGGEVRIKAMENKEKLPNAIDLHKKLVAEGKTANSWYYEVSQCSPLCDRVYICKKCRLKIDRDLNASINLENYPNYELKTTDSLSESQACGDLKQLDSFTIKDSRKQEVNIKHWQLSLFELIE